MTGPSVQDVESAVRSVLAGFLARPGRNGHRSAPSDAPEPFAGRLFSLRHAEALAPSARVVRIVPGTVVTPLARDVLKRRGVELRFVSEGSGSTSRPGGRGEWGFAVESDSGLVYPLRRALLGGPEVWMELDGGAAGWVAEGSGRGALLVTDEAAVAVWSACQVPGVRAAAVADVEEGARAVRSLGANLFVVEPRGKSIALLRMIGQVLRKGGAPRAPEWLGLEAGGRP